MEVILLAGALGLAYWIFNQQLAEKNPLPTSEAGSAVVARLTLPRELGFNMMAPVKPVSGLLKAYGMPVSQVTEIGVAHPKVSPMDQAVDRLKELYAQGNANGLEAMAVAAKNEPLHPGHGVWFVRVSYKDGTSDIRAFVTKV